MDGVSVAVLHIREHLVEGAEGNEHDVVGAPAQEGAPLLQEADDPEGHAVDDEFLVDGIPVEPQRLGHVRAHHRGARGVGDVRIGEEAPICDPGVVGRGVVRLHARQGGAVGLLAFAVLEGGGGGQGREVQVALGAHGRGQGVEPLEGPGVFEGEVAPLQLLLRKPRRAAAEAGFVLLVLHQGGAEAGEGARDGLVEPGHEAHHGDDRGHPGDDAQQGQEAPQALDPDGAEGEADVLDANAAEGGAGVGCHRL